ncbi:hypothetical protein VTP01DRAFT_7399 [Rhizomucor pusillus]|uniref:uncharacterized protein n=1 Tax=Rhizomucor pusillus TaxID=4840 RepID=UPI003743760B
MDINNLLNRTGQPEDESKKHKCTWADCNKEFTRRSDMVRHQRSHTGEKPFACTWPGCTRRFIQRSALTVHYRVHTGEKPHICEVESCRKAFADSSSLCRHRRTHSGVRPFVCHCKRAFTRLSILNRHQRQEHPEMLQSEAPSADPNTGNTGVEPTSSTSTSLSTPAVISPPPQPYEYTGISAPPRPSSMPIQAQALGLSSNSRHPPTFVSFEASSGMQSLFQLPAQNSPSIKQSPSSPRPLTPPNPSCEQSRVVSVTPWVTPIVPIKHECKDVSL